MADHALAGRNRSRKRVANGMSLLVPRNSGVGRCALSQISILCVASGVLRGTIVCVNHVARRAAAASKIAGLVIGTGKREKRIEKTRFLQTEKNGIRTKQGAETTFAQFIVGTAGFFLAIGISDFTFLPAAAFENT